MCGRRFVQPFVIPPTHTHTNKLSLHSTSMKIASCTLNLVKNAAMYSNIELIVAFHTWFLFLHLKYLQEGDPIAGNTASFLVRYVTV